MTFAEGHPVITAEEQPVITAEEQPASSSLISAEPYSIEEAIVQAELIFEDEADMTLALTSTDGSIPDMSAEDHGNQITVDKEMSEIDPCFIVPDYGDELLTTNDKDSDITDTKSDAAETKSDVTSEPVTVDVISEPCAKELTSPTGKRTSPRTCSKKLLAETVTIYCDAPAVVVERTTRAALVTKSVVEPIVIDISDDGSAADTSPKVNLID